MQHDAQHHELIPSRSRADGIIFGDSPEAVVALLRKAVLATTQNSPAEDAKRRQLVADKG